jgi:signal transduction histidine kinase
MNCAQDLRRHAPARVVADLRCLVQHVAREFEVVARQQNRQVTMVDAPWRIFCDVDEIGILLRNLIDNALRFTKHGGTVRIGCGERHAAGVAQAFSDVADDGPGVPMSERGAVFGTRYLDVNRC